MQKECEIILSLCCHCDALSFCNNYIAMLCIHESQHWKQRRDKTRREDRKKSERQHQQWVHYPVLTAVLISAFPISHIHTLSTVWVVWWQKLLLLTNDPGKKEKKWHYLLYLMWSLNGLSPAYTCLKTDSKCQENRRTLTQSSCFNKTVCVLCEQLFCSFILYRRLIGI